MPAKPDAMFVVGFKAWLELGYCVTKGQSAIRIIARLRIKGARPALWRADGLRRLVRGPSRRVTPFGSVTLTKFEVRVAEAARDQSSAPAGSTKRDGTRDSDPLV